MLDKDFFTPASLAVIGASGNPEKLGYVLLQNILEGGYQWGVYPVNPKEREILSRPVYANVRDIPDPVDLALVVVPGQAVMGVLQDCAARGIKRIVMISAGFKEIGEAGLEREREMLRLAEENGMRILGPNCLGFIDAGIKLNATFASGVHEAGNIALVAQSGAMRQSFWDWAQMTGGGFSKFVSLGNAANITESDVIEMLRDDEQTQVITAYLEGISDGRRFRSLAAAVSRVKPLLVLKVGRSAAGSRASVSHTGSLAGDNEIHEAVFRQTGIIQAQTPEQLFDYSYGLATQPLLRGDRIAIITNAGGPGVMASDAIAASGLQLAKFSEATVDQLRAVMPSFGSSSNPVDLTGGATDEMYRQVLETVLADDGVDGLLVVLCPQGPVNVAGTAAAVAEVSPQFDKPVFANFMGALDHDADLAVLREHSVPNYLSPERAVDGFTAMNRYRRWLEMEVEPAVKFDYDRTAVEQTLHNDSQSEPRVIAGQPALQILEAVGIPTARASLATDAEAAVRLAAEIGYPVVMKIESPDIVHKTEFGGVVVGLDSTEAIRAAYETMVANVQKHGVSRIDGVMLQKMATGREVILGLKRDAQYGHAVLFGIGGIYAEVMKDVSLRVAPLTRRDAADMIHEIRSYALLAGARGAEPADLEALTESLLRLSQLAGDFPQIRELDINPLLVAKIGEGVTAVDCRLVI